MNAVSTTRPIQLKEGEELFKKLAVAVSHFRTFSGSHPRFEDSCGNFVNAIGDFFANHPEQKHLLFVQRKGQVFFRKFPLTALTPPAIKFTQLLSEKKLEGYRLGPDSNPAALTCVIDGLHSVDPEGDEPTWKAINRSLENQGMKSRLGFFAAGELAGFTEEDDGLELNESADPVSSVLALPEMAMPLELYKSSLVALHDLMSLLGAGGSPKFDTLIDVTRQITAGVIEGEQDFLQLTSVHYSSEFTFNHSVNVCLLVTAASKPLTSDPEWLLKIGQAALLHDLGKSLVPQELLYKEGALEKEEREEIKRHCVLGAEILQDTQGIDPLSVVVAYDHHRRPNGAGYPPRPRQDPVDVLTSLVAAADILEALIAERPYKRGLTPAQAFEAFPRLPEAKGLAKAQRLLLDTLGLFPPGTFVELDTGEYAVVSKTRPGAPDQPRVRLVSSSGAERQISSEEIDLAAPEPGRAVPRIVKVLPDRWWSADPITPEEEHVDESDDELQDVERRLADGTLLASEG